jgi:AbrB family looped-hinge helix DNA binding protein
MRVNNMQARAKITSKGQITVPREVRRALGVKEGDNLVFEKTDVGFTVRPAREKSAFAKYRGIGNPGTSSGREAVLRATREIRGRKSDK